MQGGITHNSTLDKSSESFNWTAPAAGTGAIRFGYALLIVQIGYQVKMVALLFRFAVVQVQNTYWANQRTAMVAEGEYSHWLIHNVIATMHKLLMLFVD